MAVRVAQHYVQAVGTPEQSGELRVRRVYADTLVTNLSAGPVTHNESVNNAMSLSQGLHGFIPDQAASSVMSLNHTATYTGIKPAAASNTLNLISMGNRTQSGAPSNTLTLSSVVVAFNLIGDRQPVGNVMNLTQSVTSLSAAGASSVMNLTQSVSIQFPIKISVSSHMSLTQRLPTPLQVSATTTLSLVQTVGRNLPPENVSHTLNLIQDSPIGRFDHTLNLTQTVEWGKSENVSHDLNLTSTVTYEGIFLRSVEHTNILGHALTWYEDGPCDKKNYAPFQGENTIPNDATTPPRETLQDPQGDTDTFSLYQPVLGTPTNQVTLRKPEMDNRDRNAYTRVNNETRGGEVIVFADPTWPKVRTLAVTVVGLTETQVDDLQTFMRSTLGEYIGLTDWEGRLWKGIITNPNEPAVQDGRDRWTVTFQFEGEMLDVEQPGEDDGDGTVMNLTQTVTWEIV